MKKYIFIALAAIAALSSCSKESPVSNEENGKEARVFTATMEDGITTKVTFDGTNKCALWEVNDEISIDGHTYKATSAGASSTFTGSGATETTHHAYFPASIYNGGTPALPAEQTYAEGKFNMPMYAESSSLDLSFKNLCAVLAITVNKSNLVSTTTTSLKSIKVSSDKRMNGAFSATSAGVLSFTSQADPADAEKSVTLKIDGGVDISTDKTFYIAIPAQEYSYLKIYLSADGSTYKEAMITQKAAGLGTIARSTMFNITYKTNAVQLYADGPYWATMNLGATTVAGSASTCYGDYFAWGANKLAYSSLSSGTFTFVASRPTGYGGNGWEQIDGFAEVNAPYYFYGGAVYAKYNTSDSKTVLVSKDDAATALLGSSWRMPTKEDFQALYDACLNGSYDTTTNPSGASASVGKGVYWCTSYDGAAGCLFCDGTNKLFFPAAGYGDGTDLHAAGDNGCYWSSSLDTDYTDFAYNLTFFSDNVIPQDSNHRYYGVSVRPVLD